MLGSFNAEIDQFWRLVNALIEGVAGGPVDPRLERFLDYFAVASVLVVALVVVVVFDEIVKYAREEFLDAGNKKIGANECESAIIVYLGRQGNSKTNTPNSRPVCIRTHLEFHNNRRAERIVREERFRRSPSRLDLQPVSHRPLVIGRLVVRGELVLTEIRQLCSRNQQEKRKLAVQRGTEKESVMNKILIASILAGSVAAAPALAQTAPTPATPSATTSPATETPSGAPSTNTTTAPGSSEALSNPAVSPVEQDRLDPSAPSDLRLQIDNGASAATVLSPDTPTTQSVSPGVSLDTIEGTPSSSGASAGISGSSSSTGVTINPTTPPIGSPSANISRAGSSFNEIGAGIAGTSATTNIPIGAMPSTAMSGTRSVRSSSRSGGHR